MAPSIAQILAPPIEDESLVERIAHRTRKPPITIVEPNPLWPTRYLEAKSRIENALGRQAISIAHVGSTSVAGLPAKDIIDVDVVLQDVEDEAAWVKLLEDAGFRFLLREPSWNQHRFFVEDWPGAFFVNLHCWGLDSAEAARHQIFRDWLLKTPADVELYAKVKREAAEAATAAGETLMQYTDRKAGTIQEILHRAFRDLGYIE